MLPARRSSPLLEAQLVVATALIVFQFDQAGGGGILQQCGEAGVPVVAFVETGVDPADGLLEHRAPDRVVILLQRPQDLQQPIDGFLLFVVLFLLAFFGAGRLFWATRIRSS